MDRVGSTGDSAAHPLTTQTATRAQLNAVSAVVEELAGKFSLQPLLERILRRSVELLGCQSGSIATVDETAGTYRKETDIGVACQSGRSFPLSEGVTGAVVAARRTVFFSDYAEVPGGHISTDDRSRLHAVIGVPIEWGGDIIGACVVFAPDAERMFTTDDALLLELFARHAAIAITNARMHIEAADRARTEAATAERERLVREVHDTVTRSIASVLLHVDSAAKLLPNGPADTSLGAEIAAARDGARTALAETRRTVLGLGPSLLEGRSLQDAIGLEVAWANSNADLDARFLVAGMPRALDSDSSHDMLRIAQEALMNIIAHADARSARVGLVYGQDSVALLVEDDGRGFDTGLLAAPEYLSRQGLRGMAARASRLGGSVHWDSTPGWGTRIRAHIPYQRAILETNPDLRIRVLIADPHPIVRAGLVRLLAVEPGIQVVSELDRADQVVDACRLLGPDVVLSDIRLPEMGGVGLTETILAETSNTAVVLLCNDSADPLIADAVKVGARGCLSRDVDGTQLARAVLAAVQGQVTLPAGTFRPTSETEPLTPREQQVKALVEAGRADKEIAAELGISVKTVEKHVSAILRKLEVRNRTALAVLARR